ncbi:MAG: DUF2244 domain-containing protein [Gammaproteobacteria bacterium]|nr:DUF2244 domain-containing protein [Gammaproteobacteria bacterium]
MELLSHINLKDEPLECDGSQLDPVAGLRIQSEGDLIRIELRSNASTNQQALVICVLILSIAALAIAIIFALFGAWLVLPFAGLEILLLAIGTYIVCSHSDDADVLVISRNYVHLTQRRRSKQSVSSFFRQWTKFVLLPGKTGQEPVRLLVVSRAKELEIGEFLIESSKKRLYWQSAEWV